MNKWFKIAGVVGVVILVASLVAGVAWAQGPADEDGDGRRDVCGEELGDGLSGRWRDRLDDVMPSQGRGPGADDDMPCDEYVDEDGDGVCDLHGEELGERPFAGHMRPGFSGRGRMGR